IVERVNVQFCRAVVGVDCEPATSAYGPRCIVGTREVRLNSDVSIPTIARGEICRSLPAMEFVEGDAGGIDDIRTKEICASNCECVVLAVHAVICRKEVSVDVKPDRLNPRLAQISSEQLVIGRHLVVNTSDPVCPIIDRGTAVENLSARV